MLIAIAGVYAYYRLHRAAPPIAPIAANQELPDLLSQLPPDAPVVVYADVAELGKSPFIQQLEAWAPSTVEDPDYLQFVQQTGFDYGRDLDHVAIASWPDTQRDVADVQAGRPLSGSSIALADGHFDKAKISAYAMQHGKVTHEGNQEIYEIAEQPPQTTVYLAFLAPTRMALASGRDLSSVLAVEGRPTRPPEMQQRISRVAGAPLFVIGEVEDLARQLPLNFGNSQQLQTLLGSIRGFAIAGQPKAANFNLAADLDCDTVSHAFQLATLLDSLRWLGRAALADPRNRQQMSHDQAQLLDTLLRTVSVAHYSNKIQLRLEATPTMLREALPPVRVRKAG